jgi:gamma-glutamyltranspeptidase/glutathione hydrolase
MLKQGGSAIDAAIATQMVLTLVEPQSSGIGGGAFLMYYDGKKVQAFDGRETAPAEGRHENLFQHPDGTPLSRTAGIVGGRSVGAPGVLRMLEMAHKQHGKLPWKTLFEPAIRWRARGFAVSPRLNGLLKFTSTSARTRPRAAYFYDKDGKPWPVGHILKNPGTGAHPARDRRGRRRRLLHRPHRARHRGQGGQPIRPIPGLLTAADIAAYQPKLRTPVCSDYRAIPCAACRRRPRAASPWRRCWASSKRATWQTLAPVDGVPRRRAVHLFSEAGRLAYADRNRYAADTDFVPLPGRGVPA